MANSSNASNPLVLETPVTDASSSCISQALAEAAAECARGYIQSSAAETLVAQGMQLARPYLEAQGFVLRSAGATRTRLWPTRCERTCLQTWHDPASGHAVVLETSLFVAHQAPPEGQCRIRYRAADHRDALGFPESHFAELVFDMAQAQLGASPQAGPSVESLSALVQRGYEQLSPARCKNCLEPFVQEVGATRTP